MNSVSATLKKHWHLVVFTLGLVLILGFIWALRNVLLPFIIGFLFASLILPIIKWIEKRLPSVGKKTQLKRISLILFVYLFALTVVGAVIFYVIFVMGKSFLVMAQDAPQLIPNGLAAISKWLKSLSFLSAPSIQVQIDALALKASEAVGPAIQGFLSGGLESIKSSAGMILGFTIMPIFTFFILKDWNYLRDRFYEVLPPWVRIHTVNILAVIERVTGRYVRGQLLLALAVGTCAAILLFGLQIQFALPLAIFAGLTEMVPMIGPWLGGGLAVLVTLSTAPEKIIWVGLGFLLIQLLENNLLVPKIQGSQMEIHPAFIILLSVLGAYFAGILGFIIVLPLTMTFLGIFKYMRKSAQEGSISEATMPNQQ